MILRRLYSLLLALLLSAAGGSASAGAVYTFGGAASVSNCTLSGAVYTCPSLPLKAWDDDMVIVSGYTVKITADTTFGYNHSLTMSGSAVLMSTGDLNIGGIATNNLKITGGTLIAGDVFSVGAQDQTLTADIQAVTANLGTGSDLNLTGSIKATGTVTVASHAIINGPISGATVTTNSPVTLVGDIVATNSFTLASGSTVKGNVTAPVVRLLPSNTSVQGNITAKTSLQLGSSDTVTGNVAAGTLTLDSSEAIVNGNATIDSGVFNWHGRVTQTIYCSGGTTTGKCDCVSNNSGYEVNTANGPHCQGKVVPLDHFVINYDQTGSVCAPSKVTITACANQACTALYGGGATVTLTATGQPSQSVAIPTTGSAQASVSWSQTGTFTLGVSGATTANATTCTNGNAAPGADCKVTVAGSVFNMTMSSAASYAEAPVPPQLTLEALGYDANPKTSNKCVPLFNNVDRDINFTCIYSNPTGGTLPVRLNKIPLNGSQNAAAACDGTGAKLKLRFDQDGKTAVSLQYADVGAVTVQATDSGPGGPPQAKVTTTFVPTALTLALPNTNAPYVAGKPFTATVTALNAASPPAVTPNFGLEQQAEIAKLTGVSCQPRTGYGLPGQTLSAVSRGVQTLNATWSETGRMDLDASIAKPVDTTTTPYTGGYLNTGLQTKSASTNVASPPGCTGAVGTFSPAFFTLDTDTDWKRTAAVSGGSLLQYYSGEPAIKLTVTAHNAGNGVTKNYSGNDARDVLFTALNPDETALAAGAFSRSATYPASDTTGKAQLRGTEFNAGIATWTGSYTFTKALTGQTLLRVRATEDLPAAQSPASSSTLAAYKLFGTEPTLLVRSGRIRMPSRFGPAGATLKVPVSIEYYTGQTWMLNTEDSTTVLPAGSPGIVSTGAVGYTIASTLSPGFTNGKAELTLKPSIAGHVSAPFALNLGSTPANTSCYVARKVPMSDSTAGALPFLRSVDGSCPAAGAVDPSALATFGVYAPETKRVIHTREVFR
jgi:MSHA biogenesis protein MshQ